MGWTVILEDERKRKINLLEGEFISEEVFNTSLGNVFKLIKYLDPYGDAVFNHLQMDDLILDFKKLQEVSFDEKNEKIIELALKCKSEPHTYLAFYGD